MESESSVPTTWTPVGLDGLYKDTFRSTMPAKPTLEEAAARYDRIHEKAVQARAARRIAQTLNTDTMAVSTLNFMTAPVEPQTTARVERQGADMQAVARNFMMQPA